MKPGFNALIFFSRRAPEVSHASTLTLKLAQKHNTDYQRYHDGEDASG